MDESGATPDWKGIRDRGRHEAVREQDLSSRGESTGPGAQNSRKGKDLASKIKSEPEVAQGKGKEKHATLRPRTMEQPICLLVAKFSMLMRVHDIVSFHDDNHLMRTYSGTEPDGEIRTVKCSGKNVQTVVFNSYRYEY